MSAPPQLIHIKRKRGDEDAPVTYLQLEQGVKRHMTYDNWVYRRRIAGIKSSSKSVVTQIKPVIQTSKAGDELAAPDRPPPTSTSTPRKGTSNNAPPADQPASEGQAPAPSTSPPANSPSSQRRTSPAAQPRRFHMSRSAMSSPGGSTILKAGGVSKRSRYGTAVFVERGKTKAARKLFGTLSAGKTDAPVASVDVEMGDSNKTAPKKPLAKRPRPGAGGNVETDRKPMPSVAPSQDMSKIAADMDQWVLHEIGLNLKAMEQQAPPPAAASPSRFKPKAPAKRFAERHPEVAKKLEGGEHRDEAMTDVSTGEDEEESDDDYVIEVYELAPAKAALVNVPPEQIGVLQFDTQEDLELFYGNDENDSDDYDDEDENAENHYTADYPEDEVDSEDEYDRHAYLFRNANASDGEEFDVDDQDDEDDDMYVMEGDERRDEEDVFQEKIRRYIRQHGSN